MTMAISGMRSRFGHFCSSRFSFRWAVHGGCPEDTVERMRGESLSEVAINVTARHLADASERSLGRRGLGRAAT